MDVTERFLNYISYETTSDEFSETVPSSVKEKALGEAIKDELAAIGLKDAVMNEYGYVYAQLPATPGCTLPPIGLIAHMDTSPDASGKDVKAAKVVFDGSDIVLNSGVVLSPKNFPSLNKYLGQTLLVTDGTTLLGADDKAGIAEIVTAAEYFCEHPEASHRALSIAFTPDEEIGRGPDCFDLKQIHGDYAYTVDGGALGEIEFENFNAAAVTVTIKGVNIHPGDAKGKMKNAVLIGNEFIGLLPPLEIPACTEGYEGFYHVQSISANESSAVIRMILRDHDREKFEAKKEKVRQICSVINEKYGQETATARIQDSYYNMKEKIEPVMHIVEEAKRAMENAGVQWEILPIRGGTDGATLSHKGLPCPNLSTGGENYHSIYEYIPIRSMEKMTEVLINLCKA